MATPKHLCEVLLSCHEADIRPKHGTQLTNWYARHCAAWRYPATPAEKGIRHLIHGFAFLVDQAACDSDGETLLGNDGYFHEHAKDMVLAMLAYLNFECGRFDCGSLDKLIRQLAAAAGVELEP
jgi:hypothetical protein